MATHFDRFAVTFTPRSSRDHTTIFVAAALSRVNDRMGDALLRLPFDVAIVCDGIKIFIFLVISSLKEDSFFRVVLYHGNAIAPC